MIIDDQAFSSRWNWDSPTPLAAGECAPPPFGPGGERLKGWGSPNSNEGTYTVVLYIYKYFVGDTHEDRERVTGEGVGVGEEPNYTTT
jgi:hypothetical protein